MITKHWVNVPCWREEPEDSFLGKISVFDMYQWG